MDRWADTVLRVAYTWTGSVHDAQDICQTVLLKLLTSSRRFDEERLERAWVLRVTVNCCKDLRKSAWQRRRAPLEAAGEEAVYLPEPGESPVLEAVQALPEKYRLVIHLFYYEDYSVREIADILRITPDNVKTRLSRGRASLRSTLKEAW